MRAKKADDEHIKKLGERWPEAVAAASLSVRTNTKLVGLDKIRNDLVLQAAFHATGLEGHEGFVAPRSAGKPTQEMQDIIDAAFADAVTAVREKLQVFA
jgi:hypothetical protein